MKVTEILEEKCLSIHNEDTLKLVFFQKENI